MAHALRVSASIVFVTPACRVQFVRSGCIVRAGSRMTRTAVTGALMACLLVLLPTQTLAESPSPSADVPAVVTPAEWASLTLKTCRAATEQTYAADAALSRKLDSTPPSREQETFLTRELDARARAAKSGRRAALMRLNALLVGDDARFPLRGSRESDSFLDVLIGLLGHEDVCAIGAIEATVLFGVLGIPFNADSALHAGPDHEFQLIGGYVTDRLVKNDSLDQIFESMRPASIGDTLHYVETVTRQAILMRQPTASDGEVEPDIELRLRQFLEFIRYASEPIRIQIHLDAKVDAIEGAIGTVLPDGADQRLFQKVEDQLYSSVDRMRRLQERPPRAILDAIEPIVNRWFQATALPAVRRSLAKDPFAAYWFFVQSGGVASAGPVFTGSHVHVDTPLFALSELKELRLSEALAYLEDVRVPAHFLEQHAVLESAFTELTLSPGEVLAGIRRIEAPPQLARTISEFMLGDSPSPRGSSLDVYSRIVRDASKIGGRLDRDAVTAAINIIYAAKARHLDQEIQRLLGTVPTHDSRLAAYLRTDAALMLELEQRQALESTFRQGTSGAAIGFLLSQFFIGGSVPVELWAPGGVTGPEFAQLVDALAPKNRKSGNNYAGKPVSRIDLVHDGREYHAALVTVIDSARNFINISSFDWTTDAGGRDIAYRLMAKKLGIDGPRYAEFLATFGHGLPMDRTNPSVVAFYDIPTTRMKDLLVTYFILTSEDSEVAQAREALRAAGATLDCTTVLTCGDLEALREQTGIRYDRHRRSIASDRAWLAYQQIEALFSDRPPPLNQVRPRRALRDYCEDPDALRRFVRRVGARRADRPAEPFFINVVADAKRNLSNVHIGQRSEQFPYFVTESIRDIYFVLLEFDARVVLWKGAMEFPWHIGPVPVPGRKFLGFIPMPFVPWPWLGTIGGFTWAGPYTSVFLQYLLATDVRVWWAMVNHTKSWSNESMALESGMGMGSKYFNQFEEYRTWHDMGVLVRGAIVDDVNDHFVQVFNEARKNNTGLPSSRGVRIPRLRYEDYQSGEQPAAQPGEHRSWVLTTHPEQGDSNYRGVFVAALAAARHNIYIENPFFSDPLIARMLIHKAREFRGRVNCAGLDSHACAVRTREAVQIHLVLPDVTDKPIVDAVGTADFQEMLHLGIKVYRWHPPAGWSATRMLHSKVWLIDYEAGRGGLAYVGAANATQRSHLADNEAGILSNDPGFARQVHERVFQPDMTTDSRLESEEGFQVVWSSSRVVRASRWLRRLLVELFWFI
jgi:phosphatidylserine/phosphatidylglycerophosphate/cardiolipin synthase-like enzyme